ncbi:MAG TPA: penicillin-binding protein 1A [Steroidobacteraceae bacterium]|nr:penicillin-binding protein 1A [Steroidobacteraceae bacterium]
MVGLIALIVFANVCAYVYLRPALPDVGSLREVQLQVPLRIYSRDGKLIQSIGEQRRIPVRYDQLPPKLIQAFLATEDDRFFRHHGVDWQGILRAAVANLRAGGIRQGASTITMQVSRDMFLTPRRDMKRKMSEIYISLLMEAEFTKEEIFSLYVNKIFLGQRAYGVGAAAEVYFGKGLDQLSLAEMATLAGIPTSPSTVNPVASAEAAKVRRTHVLGRMLDLGYISQSEYDQAKSSPMESRLHGASIEVDAPYLAEMVRNDMQNKYGDAVYTAGYKVYTTLDSRLQAAGTVALRTGLIEYDMRHGYRGASAKVDLSKIVTPAQFDAQLEEFPVIGGLKPAIVEQVEAKSAKIYVKDLGAVTLLWEKLAWARRELPDEKVDRYPTQATEVLSRGDVIYTVGRTPESVLFVQIPEAQSALVSVDPKDGAVVALVGGFDFFQSKFNRVIQARRQPGSGFKPFIYAAAFDKGFTPASVVLDAPVVIDEEGKEQAWRPHEDTGMFYGPVRLRDALVHSRNLVSVRLMRAIGGPYARDYVTRFGFDKSQLPDDLTLALGTAELSPLQVAIGYSAFANGGFKVSSYYIDRIEDANGKVLQQANPAIACPQCGRPSDGPSPKSVSGGRSALLDEAPHDGKTMISVKNMAPQILRPQVAYLLADMMADVIKRGTGQRARTLNRDDIAGKTGTSNDFHDAWFNGFNGDIVTTVWTGFDAERSLGDNNDQAARVAVPTWTYFMKQALEGTARHGVPVPDGIVSVRISPKTGLLASSDDPTGIMEKFIEGNLPKAELYEGQNPNSPEADKPIF